MIFWLRRMALVAIVTLPPASGLAETRYTGLLGLGYDVHDYTGSSVDRPGTNTLRQLFYHKIDFGLSSTILKDRIGTFSADLSLQGYYDRANTEFGRSTNYYAPDLRNYGAGVYLMPRSRIPFSLYATQRHYYSLNYEQKNRYIVISERPNLAVVRKYENRRRALGGDVLFQPLRTLSLRGLYEKSQTEVSRIYDFGEDRDMFSQIVPQQSPPNQPDYRVIFTNNLPETLTVFMDDTVLIRSLAPAGQQLLDVPAGLHRFDLRAPSYNTFTTRYDVSSNLLWVVLYNLPATPNDRDATSGIAQFSALYEPNGKLREEFRISGGDEMEAVLSSRSTSRIGYNNLLYKFNSKFFVQSLITQSRLATTFTGQEEEVQNTYVQFTTINYVPDDRNTATLMHNLSVLNNRGLRTTINGVEAAGWRRMTRRYTADVRARITRTTDTRDFVKEELAFGTGHQLRDLNLYVAKSALRELFELKTSTEYNPGRAQTEYINRLGLDNSLGRLGALGDLTLTGEYSARWFTDVSGDIWENRFRLMLSVINNAVSRLRLAGFLIRETSNITGTGSQAGTSTDNTTARVSFNLKVSQSATLMGSYMLVAQRDVDIARYQTSFNWKLFGLPAQHTIGYDEERKTLLQFGTEIYRTFAQKLSFRWRRIELLLEHEIVFEDVRLGRARYQGVRFEGRRRFDL